MKLRYLLKELVKARILILYLTVGFGLILLIYGVVVPREYLSRGQILPQMDIGGIVGMSGSIGGFGDQESRLARIARAAGLSFGYSSGDIISAILQSRSVMEDVIDECEIMRHYRIKQDRMEDALEKLEELTNIQITIEDIVRIECIGKSRELAAKLVNSYINNLDRFLREKSMSTGKNMRIFVEKRLSEVELELTAAAESLKLYQESSKVVVPDEELKAAIEAYAILKAQLFAKEVQADIIKAYSSATAPYYTSIKVEIDAIKRRLSQIESKGVIEDGFGVGFGVSFADIPEVMQEYFKRYLDLRIQEEVYAFLKQQYEQARIMEVKDTPVITVLDWGKPPVRKHAPKIFKLMCIGALIGFCVGILRCVGAVLIADLLSKRERRQILRELSDTIRGDVNRILSLLLRRKK